MASTRQVKGDIDMTTITYHDRYVGESGPRTMFTQRHYKFIAEVLLSVGNYPTKDLIVDYFIKALELDNPNFKPNLFRKASDDRY